MLLPFFVGKFMWFYCSFVMFGRKKGNLSLKIGAIGIMLFIKGSVVFEMSSVGFFSDFCALYFFVSIS